MQPLSITKTAKKWHIFKAPTQNTNMPRALSEEQRKRREEAVYLPSLNLQKKALEHIDGIPISLVKGEQEVLHILLFSEESVTIEVVRRTYQNALIVHADRLLHYGDKQIRPVDALFSEYHKMNEDFSNGKYSPTEYMEKLNKLRDKVSAYPFFSGGPLRVPSYEKIQNDLISLEMLGLVGSRKDGNAIVWRVSDDFYARWVNRRKELLGEIRNKTTYLEDLPDSIKTFYHLNFLPSNSLSLIFLFFLSDGSDYHKRGIYKGNRVDCWSALRASLGGKIYNAVGVQVLPVGR